MLLIMIPDQYPNYYKVLEIYTAYFDSLDIMILFSYPSSIVITRDYCMYSFLHPNTSTLGSTCEMNYRQMMSGHFILGSGVALKKNN